MIRYYLIYGWDLAKRQIIHPTIKEVNTEEIYYNLPEVLGYKFVKCYCSNNREEIELWFNKTCEPFEKKNISYANQVIKNMEKLCKLQEERLVNEEWKKTKWLEDDLPF